MSNLIVAKQKNNHTRAFLTKLVQESSEPTRDWNVGPITGHRASTVFVLAFGLYLFYLIQSLIWPKGTNPETFFDHIWIWGSLLWVAPVYFGALGVIGAILYKHPKDLDSVNSIENLVSWRIVSRGINVDALNTTIKRCVSEMKKTPLFPYIVEVVTDTNSKNIIKGKNIYHLQVPEGYKTANNSAYKARALQFASENSNLPGDAWIVHLDEETQPTSSSIKGIAKMISKERQLETPKIGQGAILYHRKWTEFPFLTLADNIRTGVDFGQFYLQHRLGINLFGFHGSYIVVRNDLEQSIGFDFGPNGSITEDAFWGLVAMNRGFRCTWVEGYLEEQSTQSYMDFIRQRRRWIQGLMKVVIYAPVELKWKISLGINILLWNLGPFAVLYTLIHFFYGFNQGIVIKSLANFSFVSFLVLYLLGLKANLNEHGVTNLFIKTKWILAQILLFPVFSLMESLGVLAAIVKPVQGFHVVKK